MALRETATAEPEVDIAVDELKGEALKQSPDVKSYVAALSERARHLEGNDAASRNPDKENVPKRMQGMSGETRTQVAKKLGKEAHETDIATQGNQDLQFDHALDGTPTQGYATINGGRGSIRLTTNSVRNVATAQGKNQFKNLTAHENAHATEQGGAMGDIRMANGTMTGWEAHERHSEKRGAEEEGKNAQNFHRDGQPGQYAKAQDKGNDLLKLGVTDAEFDRYMAEGGVSGTQKLQARVLELELKKGVITPEQMKKNLDEGRDTYARALQDAILKESPDATEMQVTSHV